MNKLIVQLIITLIFNVSIFGQERQSDATWDETISFIEDHIEFMQDSSTIISFETKMSNDHLTLSVLTRFLKDGKEYDERSINLNDLTSANEFIVTPTGYIRLTARWRGVSKKFKNTIEHTNKLEIVINDDVMRKRFLKAFVHLAYLSNEKQSNRKKKESYKF
jgi:hypothetical protein|tara:strand:- start:11 stop:499 length:489 start_codon:yes stop_codon:yes gene_type:complete